MLPILAIFVRKVQSLPSNAYVRCILAYILRLGCVIVSCFQGWALPISIARCPGHVNFELDQLSFKTRGAVTVSIIQIKYYLNSVSSFNHGQVDYIDGQVEIMCTSPKGQPTRNPLINVLSS